MKIITPHEESFLKFAGEVLEGGEADGKNPKVSKKEQEEGVSVEMEHTKHPEISKEISDDHHSEDKNYYKKLDKMENPPKMDKDQRLIANFLKKEPKPKDKDFHAMADKAGTNEHKMEEKAYSLLAKYTNTFADKK